MPQPEDANVAPDQVDKALLPPAGVMPIGGAMADAAANDFYQCRVNGAGAVDNGTILIALSDTANPPAFPMAWFAASDGMKREMLAAALTAIAGGFVVSAQLRTPAVAYSTCTVLQVVTWGR